MKVAYFSVSMIAVGMVINAGCQRPAPVRQPYAASSTMQQQSAVPSQQVYPGGEGGAYPSGQGSAYPSGEGSAYPSGQGGASPSSQGGAYPSGDGGAYPSGDGSAYSSGGSGAYPTDDSVYSSQPSASGSQGDAYSSSPSSQAVPQQSPIGSQ